MPRPHIEAVALLAAHGFSVPSGPNRPRSTLHGAFTMADLSRFAFVRRIDPVTKPIVFPGGLAELARFIERERKGAAIQLEQVEDLEVRGSPDLHTGVQIWILDMDNARDRSLGYAWLDGAGREVLEPALRNARRSYGEAGQRRAA